VKKQLDEEVQHLSSSHQNLKNAQLKFRECKANVETGVAGSTKGLTIPVSTKGIAIVGNASADHLTDKPILVPLTSSLYAPGKLADTEHVIVDVGTGFYVEKTTKDAQQFYEGKVEELGKNIKDLENIVNGKANNLRMVEEVLRQKMLSEQQNGAATSGTD